MDPSIIHIDYNVTYLIKTLACEPMACTLAFLITRFSCLRSPNQPRVLSPSLRRYTCQETRIAIIDPVVNAASH